MTARPSSIARVPCTSSRRAGRSFGRVVSVVSSDESCQTSSMITMSFSLPLTVRTSTSRTLPRSSGDSASAVAAVRITCPPFASETMRAATFTQSP